MTERERFLAAFEGKATDRPPAYEQAFASDVASEILGREAHTGSVMLHYQEAVAAVKGPEAYRDFRKRMERDVVDLARALRLGAVAGPWTIGPPTKQVGEYESLYGDPEGDWAVYRYDPDSGTYGPVQYNRKPAWRGREALKARVDEAWRGAEMWAEEEREEFTRHILHWRELVGEELEVLGRGAGLSVPLNEEWLTACALAPDLVGEYLDAQVERARQQLEAQAELGVRIVWGGGDLADNRGPIYGQRVFREIVLPRLKRIVGYAHKLGLKYVFRSDGDLWSIAEELFGKSGVDGYGEIDHDAGMRIPEVQERFPKLTCWGNVSSRLLRRGRPEQVKDAVRELIEKALPMGRWILGSSNTILPKTPVENVLAMYEAAGLI